jgi:glycosyltransferase involved in cell wall biosynthesis
MSKFPKVSVIMPCFNHGEFLPEAVGSVTSIHRDDIELIVVDDGSTDERTRNEMEILCAQGIKVVRQVNKGLAGARNAGVLISKGKYVLPLDADNRLRSAYVEHGVRILDAEPQVGIVYGDAQFIGTRTDRWRVGPFERDRLLSWNYIDACAIYRRSVWEQNRGYDATMPTQGLEDWDFWLGALEHGWKFAYVDEILFDYRVAQGSMIRRAAQFEAQVREFVAKKHGLLYRQAWESLWNERQSVRWTVRNLLRLLEARVKQGSNKDSGVSGNVSKGNAEG